MSKKSPQLLSERCLKACCAGDSDAWREFVESGSAVIYGVVSRIIQPGAPVEVDDAAQEVFLRLHARDFRLLKSFDPDRSSLATFLRVVASTTAIDLLRKHRKAPASLDYVQALDAAAGDEAIDTAEIDLSVLTDRQQLILRLLFHAQMDVRDAARALGISEQTVRSAKHKALARLRSTHQSTESGPQTARIAGDTEAADHV